MHMTHWHGGQRHLWEAGHVALMCHRGQTRKYTGEPYVTHCAEVAAIVQQHIPGNDEAIAAAWLHDVIEDCGLTRSYIASLFGDHVASLVTEVSDVSKPSDGNRAVRKALDREHYGRASPEGKAIKLADLISNTRSIVAHDPDFAKVYLAEKALLLPLLKGSAAPELWWKAADQLALAQMKIEKHFKLRETRRPALSPERGFVPGYIR